MLEMQQNELPKVPPTPWLTEDHIRPIREKAAIIHDSSAAAAVGGSIRSPSGSKRFGNIRQAEGFSRIQSKESNYEKPGYFSRYRGRRYSFNWG